VQAQHNFVGVLFKLTLDTDPGTLTSVAAMRAPRVVTYLTQPDLPSPPPHSATAAFRRYLDVWGRLAPPIGDPSILELALDGAGAADRTRVIGGLSGARGERAGNDYDGEARVSSRG